MKKNYDIAIIGGGTAGCAAAYMAGVLGLKVILLEKSIHLGGAITSGLVVPVMKCGENQINTEFYEALINELHALGGQFTYQDNPGWFNPELTKIALDNLMRKANVDVYFEAGRISPVLEGEVITSIKIEPQILSSYNETLYSNKQDVLFEYIEAKYYVDTTGDCEFSKMCNCNFLDAEKELQPPSLRFIMSGIDIKKFADWLEKFDSNRNVTTVEQKDGFIHLSTACTWDEDQHWALMPLFQKATEEGILEARDWNYFQIFSVAGTCDSIAFNCPRILTESDFTRIEDRSKSLVEARQSIFRLANFCKKYFPGFEKSQISNIADMIGIRASKRLKGKYIYTIDDLKNGKKFDNPVLISNYPVDVHSKDKNGSKLDKVNDYQLPVESLISADIKNLYVAGRCISSDFLSQGALRVQANCFAMGVGLSKYIAQLEIKNQLV